MVVWKRGRGGVAVVHQDLLALPHWLGRAHPEDGAEPRVLKVCEDCVGLIFDGAVAFVAGGG